MSPLVPRYQCKLRHKMSGIDERGISGCDERECVRIACACSKLHASDCAGGTYAAAAAFAMRAASVTEVERGRRACRFLNTDLAERCWLRLRWQC